MRIFICIGYNMRGVCTNSKREPDQSGAKRGSQVEEMNWYGS